jgi:hypothetical protein
MNHYVLQRLFLLRECGNLLVNVIKVRYPISSATAPEGTQYPLLNDKRILASLCLTLWLLLTNLPKGCQYPLTSCNTFARRLSIMMTHLQEGRLTNKHTYPTSSVSCSRGYSTPSGKGSEGINIPLTNICYLQMLPIPSQGFFRALPNPLSLRNKLASGLKIFSDTFNKFAQGCQ